MFILTVSDEGVELKDQLRDYKFRGDGLAHINFLEFMLDTYEGSTKDNGEGEDNEHIQNAAKETLPQNRGPGRPLNTRIPYQNEAGKGKRCRILRSQGHETLPRFVGKWFSRFDEENGKDLYRASMLMLLKPWRNLHQLKNITDTFENAYEQFISHADQKSLRIITNIQYYYECSDGAKQERNKSRENPQLEHAATDENDFNMDIDDTREMEEIQDGFVFNEITDEDIERARLMKTHARERLYGEIAVNLGYDTGFFEEIHQDFPFTFTARKMQPDEGEKIRTWETQLKSTTREQIKNFGTVDINNEQTEVQPSVMQMNSVDTAPEVQTQKEDQPLPDHFNQQFIGRLELSKLNEEQRRAHDIIEETLVKHMTSESGNNINSILY